jgi:hypothetical protein
LISLYLELPPSLLTLTRYDRSKLHLTL